MLSRPCRQEGNPRHRACASELGLQGFNLAQNRSPLQEWRQELKLNVN